MLSRAYTCIGGVGFPKIFISINFPVHHQTVFSLKNFLHGLALVCKQVDAYSLMAHLAVPVMRHDYWYVGIAVFV